MFAKQGISLKKLTNQSKLETGKAYILTNSSDSRALA